jgi:hypothetical protein
MPMSKPIDHDSTAREAVSVRALQAAVRRAQRHGLPVVVDRDDSQCLAPGEKYVNAITGVIGWVGDESSN